jgi:hypothetical protein
MRRRAAKVSSAVTTRSQNGIVGKKSVQGAILLIVGNDASTLAILHD